MAQFSHESTSGNAQSPGQAPGAESLRDRLARHIAGEGLASNYEAMCGAIALGSYQRSSSCPDCDGLGYAALSETRLRAFGARMINMQEEARACIASGEKRQLENALRIEQNVKEEQWELNRESVCRRCQGTGYAATPERETEQRADAMFTTVPCLACRGADERDALRNEDGSARYPSLMGRHQGSSCGESFARNDAAAERGDACPVCLGKDGQGTGYVVPITVRPRASAPDFTGDYLAIAEDASNRFEREDEYESDPEALLDRLREEDPMLAAGVTVLLGQHGDRWAQHDWGRRFALWPLMPSGRLLGKEAGTESDEADEYARQLAILEQERIAIIQTERGTPRRRVLLTMADSEARTLESRVERAIQRAEASA